MIQQYNGEEHPAQMVLKMCDKFLQKTFGIQWDDLPDTVCIYDWIDNDYLRSDISSSLIKDICWEKLADDYPSRCELNKMIYGECSCFMHDEEDD